MEIENFNTLKIDLHIHSRFSYDSCMNIDKIINVAKRRGLNGIAITDHNSIKGGIEGKRLNKCRDFLIICGSEISTERGEIMGLFLTENVKSQEALEVIDEIKSQGGLSIIPHPYKRAKKIDEEILKRIDGIEVFNSRTSYLKNKLVKKMAIEHKLPMTAGSDAHFYFEIGRGICIFKNASNPEDIRKAIIKKEMKIWGITSSPYIECLSQVIKAFKTKNIKILFTNALLGSMFISYQIIREKTFNRRKEQ